jgi:arsenate reductase-like glutaredoxin family protein
MSKDVGCNHLFINKTHLHGAKMIINWAYFRKGCASCQKAQESLGRMNVEIKTEVNARKEPLEAQKTWALLVDSRKILIASGSKIREFSPQPDKKDEILKIVLGRSGILRAPTLKIGNTFYIGYNNEMYDQLVGKG